MLNYRLYTLDSNNKIISAFNHDYDDDQAAMALVRHARADGQLAEIWRGTTRLQQWPSPETPQPEGAADV